MLSLFAENIAHKTRINYFERCLEKDASWFDDHNPTELASKISKEVSAIQRGVGEKVGMVLQSVASFFFGLAFSFFWGWKMSLILIAAFPVMMLMGVGMAAS